MMQNPLSLDESTPRGARFHAHLARSTDLKAGLIDRALGRCSFCHVTCPHHLERITCQLCKRIFHTPCLTDRLSRSTVSEIARTPSLWWFCLECLKVTNSVRSCVVHHHSSVTTRSTNHQQQPPIGRKPGLPPRSKPKRASLTNSTSEKFVNDGTIREIKSEIYTQLKGEMEEQFTEMTHQLSRAASIGSFFSPDTSTQSVSLEEEEEGEWEEEEVEKDGGVITKNGEQLRQQRTVYAPRLIRKTGSTGCLVLKSDSPGRRMISAVSPTPRKQPLRSTSSSASSSSGSSTGSCAGNINGCSRSRSTHFLSPATTRQREQNCHGLNEIKSLMERARGTTREM